MLKNNSRIKMRDIIMQEKNNNKMLHISDVFFVKASKMSLFMKIKRIIFSRLLHLFVIYIYLYNDHLPKVNHPEWMINNFNLINTYTY